MLLQASAFRIWKLCIIPCLAFFSAASFRGLLAEQNGNLWGFVSYHGSKPSCLERSGVLWVFLRRFRLEKMERGSSKICMLGSRDDHVRRGMEFPLFLGFQCCHAAVPSARCTAPVLRATLSSHRISAKLPSVPPLPSFLKESALGHHHALCCMNLTLWVYFFLKFSYSECNSEVPFSSWELGK